MSETNSSNRLRLYLIRHGEIESSAAGKLIGHTDVSLSERGVEQARLIAKKLAHAQLDAIYSSDLRRAFHMAEILAGSKRMTARSSQIWREINMGLWEGRALSDLYEEAPEQVSLLFSDPASFEYPGGESFAGFATRVQEALERLLQTHSNGEIALVAHGGVCRAIIGGVLGISMQNWLRVAQRYGCLNVISWFDSHPMVELLNYSSEEFPA